VDADDNPDRSNQYKVAEDSAQVTVVNTKTGGRQKLIDQVNENWRQLRLFKTALSDRDRVIAELHQSIFKRDTMIGRLNQKLALMNRVRPLVYGCIGAAVAKLAELGVERISRWVHF
jgi:predicted RNase H-like nuclease (RuvC/YqgF family)